ncbi:MAG: hypothetical protein ACFFDN_06870 [Candidatus Hodarchaeota archaeon]
MACIEYEDGCGEAGSDAREQFSQEDTNNFSVINDNSFLGSKDINESEIEHIEREAKWKEEHGCYKCGRFNCDGYCDREEIESEFAPNLSEEH